METVRFCCDAMLGALAHWLRFAGFDTTLPGRVDHRVLAAVARHEDRWLLTRDRCLAAHAGPRVLSLQAASTPEQLAEVCTRLRLRVDRARFFTRCSRCNGALAKLSREAAIGLTPPYVAAHAESFVRCEGCGRVYWPGTHHHRIIVGLEAAFGSALIGGGDDRGET